MSLVHLAPKLDGNDAVTGLYAGFIQCRELFAVPIGSTEANRKCRRVRQECDSRCHDVWAYTRDSH